MKNKKYRRYKEYELDYNIPQRKVGKLKIFLYALLILFFILAFIFIFRQILPRQLDDVNPFIQCDKSLLRSNTLMIIPLFHNASIAENKTWCDWILSLNKTLAMHGVFHYYNEFNDSLDESYVQNGMREFKKCFGFYPKIFEAPQLALGRENKNLLIRMGFEVRGYYFNVFHKVYHCSDTGLVSNEFVKWF